MKKETLSEKSYNLGVGGKGVLEIEDVKQSIKRILEKIDNKIEKKIKVEKKSNNYTKDDVFTYGYVSGLEDMNKLFKRIIKKEMGEELLK